MIKKLGRVKISDTFFEEEYLDVLSVIFSQFIPISISNDFDPRFKTYIGYNKEFDEVKEGFEIPSYEFIIEMIAGIPSIKEIIKS